MRFAKLLLAAFFGLTLPAAAQYSPVSSSCVLGATQANVSGTSSTNFQQGVVPGCTVTVYQAGSTSTLANLFNDPAGASPLANPFTAPASGQIVFYTSPSACYDIVLSGGTSPNTYPSPVTIHGTCTATYGTQFRIPAFLGAQLGSSSTYALAASNTTTDATGNNLSVPGAFTSQTSNGDYIANMFPNWSGPPYNGAFQGIPNALNAITHGGRLVLPATMGWPWPQLPPTYSSSGGVTATPWHDGTSVVNYVGGHEAKYFYNVTADGNFGEQDLCNWHSMPSSLYDANTTCANFMYRTDLPGFSFGNPGGNYPGDGGWFGGTSMTADTETPAAGIYSAADFTLNHLGIGDSNGIDFEMRSKLGATAPSDEGVTSLRLESGEVQYIVAGSLTSAPTPLSNGQLSVTLTGSGGSGYASNIGWLGVGHALIDTSQISLAKVSGWANIPGTLPGFAVLNVTKQDGTPISLPVSACAATVQPATPGTASGTSSTILSWQAATPANSVSAITFHYSGPDPNNGVFLQFSGFTSTQAPLGFTGPAGPSSAVAQVYNVLPASKTFVANIYYTGAATTAITESSAQATPFTFSDRMGVATPTTLYLSTPLISGQLLATGDGSTTSFSGLLPRAPAIVHTISVTAGSVTLSDNGSGALTGSGGSGTVNSSTGAYTLSFSTAPAAGTPITTVYQTSFNSTEPMFVEDIDPEQSVPLSSPPVTAPTTQNSTQIGTGDGSTATFHGSLANLPVNANSLTVTAGSVTLSDNGTGGFSGAGSGTINYFTGAYSVTFTSAPAASVAVVAAYTYPVAAVTLPLLYDHPVNKVVCQGGYAGYRVNDQDLSGMYSYYVQYLTGAPTANTIRTGFIGAGNFSNLIQGNTNNNIQIMPGANVININNPTTGLNDQQTIVIQASKGFAKGDQVQQPNNIAGAWNGVSIVHSGFSPYSSYHGLNMTFPGAVTYGAQAALEFFNVSGNQASVPSYGYPGLLSEGGKLYAPDGLDVVGVLNNVVSVDRQPDGNLLNVGANRCGDTAFTPTSYNIWYDQSDAVALSYRPCNHGRLLSLTNGSSLAVPYNITSTTSTTQGNFAALNWSFNSTYGGNAAYLGAASASTSTLTLGYAPVGTPNGQAQFLATGAQIPTGYQEHGFFTWDNYWGRLTLGHDTYSGSTPTQVIDWMVTPTSGIAIGNGTNAAPVNTIQLGTGVNISETTGVLSATGINMPSFANGSLVCTDLSHNLTTTNCNAAPPAIAFVPGTGVTSVTCVSSSCNAWRGTLSIVAGTATTGTIALIYWNNTATPSVCSVTQNGGSTYFGIGNSPATDFNVAVTADNSVAGNTVRVSYICQP